MNTIGLTSLFQNNFMYEEPEIYFSGVDTNSFNEVYAHQRNTQWCAAACIEMIAKHHGIDVAQEDLAKKHCGVDVNGNAYNCPAPLDVISRNLNFCTFQYDWAKFCISSSMHSGRPDGNRIIQEMQNGNPVVIAYKNQGSNVGHAVLITGVEWLYQNGRPVIQTLILRDPWPSVENIMNLGKRKIQGPRQFASNIYAHWYVRVNVVEPTYEDKVWYQNQFIQAQPYNPIGLL